MAERVVVVDASVLINFCHLDRLDLLGALRGCDERGLFLRIAAKQLGSGRIGRDLTVPR